ncbi:hypothetical protein CLAFUW4_02216 [Fulvia fulva]|uniref:F-box domain-containing protein n=1 Tax=Passalora fulva TaxID=5499 RepID=A0A9Q8L7P8_PASFU|nr:uncharacterized protein CLAFUR5_02206 [Fulvia fulva]KAK4635614.1 hypothetical protein CLAFUR4_02211 [Fulvia fulva]KAK4637710.1 hypothetical protein CLAFUR0_02214 [Fulvia fulva]UJO12311.1 hypothetical protein CLAFUR5_02206 [Fulvia fulva]WPV09558.1 hypothetical protein CLAFUW4_02216 [Fulvia fulva]WPV25191.1 hypothetical protein CLAFUW7_02216 [Fulvia fulva]
MAQLNNLPDELLCQIISYNVPAVLRSRIDLNQFMRDGASSKRLLRLTKDTFFRTYTHKVDITCIYTALSPRCAYTQVHTDGPLAARSSFCNQIRDANLKLHVYYPASIAIAVQELKGALGRYGQLRNIRVGISTGSHEVADELGEKVREVLDLYRSTRKRLGTCLTTELMGHQVMSCSSST